MQLKPSHSVVTGRETAPIPPPGPGFGGAASPDILNVLQQDGGNDTIAPRRRKTPPHHALSTSNPAAAP